MKKEQQIWQEDGRKAFEWIAQVYEQTKAVWDDAQSIFQEDNWTVQAGTGWGGSAAGISLDQWPFIYFKAFCATPPGISGEIATGSAAVFGFFFYDGKRLGPQCFGGRVNWSAVDANLNHWFLYHAMHGAAEAQHQSLFTISQGLTPGIRIAAPTAKAKTKFPGAEELRWFELPLSLLTSADILQTTVKATQKLVMGEEQETHTFLHSSGLIESVRS